MVDPTPSDYNLTYLRERWERDRSSRIFLQLAEEYRRRGLHAEALEVLETGLGFHPGYLAAQVALGRCRLEAGQPEVAVKVLERVLSQDPTQAVATRLLAESWLQLGDEDRAQAAIDRCRLIGIPPSELVGLDQRMAAARRAARERWSEPARPTPVPPAPAPAVREESFEETSLPWRDAEPEAAEPVPPKALPPRTRGDELRADAPPAVTGRRDEPPAHVPAEVAAASPPPSPGPAAGSPPGPAAVASEDVFRIPVRARAPIVLPLRPGVERRLAGARGSDPFGRMAAPRPRPRDGGEIFRLLPSPEPLSAAAAGASPLAPAPLVAAAAPPSAPAPPPPPAQTVRWWESSVAPAMAAAAPPPAAPSPQPPPPAPPPAAASPPSPAAPRPLAPARWWERPAEPEAPAEPVRSPGGPGAAAAAPPVTERPPPVPEETVAAVSSAPTAAPAPAVHAPPPAPPERPPLAAQRSALADTPGVELQASGTLEVPPELRPSDPGTATLGELYLRQGYVREAEEIFKQVLARDPENEAALSGLEAIGRRRAHRLTAAELVGGEPEAEVRGLTARKIQLLTRYLRALRAGEGRGTGRDVPGTAQ
jgi:tetratricopeptide (TPR) repeat protein